MKLREKIWEIIIKTQTNKVDELEQTADDFAIDFAEWVSCKYKNLDNKNWFSTTYQLEMGIFLSSKELLEIFKKEKELLEKFKKEKGYE